MKLIGGYMLKFKICIMYNFFAVRVYNDYNIVLASCKFIHVIILFIILGSIITWWQSDYWFSIITTPLRKWQCSRNCSDPIQHRTLQQHCKNIVMLQIAMQYCEDIIETLQC